MTPEHYICWIVIFLMMTGLYVVISEGNLVKKVVGLNIFQTAVLLFYIFISRGQGPVESGAEISVSALPQALILTAVVVGVATTAVAAALVICIHKTYQTIEATELERAREEEDLTVSAEDLL